jgi:hypothetical protein
MDIPKHDKMTPEERKAHDKVERAREIAEQAGESEVRIEASWEKVVRLADLTFRPSEAPVNGLASTT